MGRGKLHGVFEGTQGSKELKEKIAPKRGKPKDDIPSWAAGERPYVGESGNKFAIRVMEKQFGKGKYDKRSKNFTKLRKYADTHFK